MVDLSRRSFLRGLGAVLAAPAVARVTQLIPPLERARLNYLSLHQIARESIRMFLGTNAFLTNIDKQYQDIFAADAKVGTQLRIRLPNDYRLTTRDAA
jgi:hypothetical protein